MKKTKLSQPVTTDDGEVTEAISEIDWKANNAETAIKPADVEGAATTGIVLGAIGLLLGAGALLIGLRCRRQAT